MARSGIRAIPRILAALLAMAVLCASAAGMAAAAPGSSIRSQEWWLTSMHASDAIWPVSTGAGITVAVIDSGVDVNHPDLAGQVLQGQNFSGLSGGADTDTVGHGTAMASLIAGTGKGWEGEGMYGLAPGVKILPLRLATLGSDADVSAATFSHQLALAIRAAGDSKAEIISISMSQVESESTVRSAVDYALSKGKLIVASVGNSGNTGDPVLYPAAFPGVVGVGETDENGNVTTESEHGAQVALTAPGADMYGACVGPSGYCSGHGTSNSTALVSASAALLWAVHPSWTADQIIRVLINTANSGGKPGVQNPYYGYGLVRPRLALTEPGDPGPADVNPLLPASASTGVSAAARASVSAGQKSSGSSMVWIVGGVAVLVLGAAAAGLLLARRRARG
jgi:type VII secretion-associated serine protease mycosin